MVTFVYENRRMMGISFASGCELILYTFPARFISYVLSGI